MADPSDDPKPQVSRGTLFLQRVDQPAVILVLCVSWLFIGLFFVRLGRAKQGVIDIDQRVSRKAQLQVDLNAAPWPEFANLPGVGEVLGRTIVRFRQEHGAFRSIDDIKLVPGIGERRFTQIRPYLVISNATNQ